MCPFTTALVIAVARSDMLQNHRLPAGVAVLNTDSGEAFSGGPTRNLVMSRRQASKSCEVRCLFLRQDVHATEQCVTVASPN